ncbi:ABC transporter permease [Thiothrix fructosivorans]|uniref:ABC transporter permease n=1 Tax=Thiothrix fructosivorans TaxID=111770 RepID=A0A8B0SMD9_9GAMM|nr:ABC transporter permease [Thiothrix fructosivorans]MBO0612213.1 ABC transporter permease [Thiothrix fructosivorans]QTX12295.1 ABC transporter permease [Thiothrix fructosivorans]
MKPQDTLHFSYQALRAYPGRTALILLAMCIGVAAIILLTSLGEGARLYVIGQFQGLGSNLLIVLPGRSETTGGAPPMLGTTPRDLTLDDALALQRSPAIKDVAPIILGAAPVAYESREREVTIMGSTPALLSARQLDLALGQSLPDTNPRVATAVCLLGETVWKELFGNRPALGAWVRIGESRFRVIGVLAGKGQSLGSDMSDMVVIPVASARNLFNAPSLFRIIVTASSQGQLPQAEQDIEQIIRQRHDGENDITIIAQDSLIGTFDNILGALTWALGGIAAISLIVAGILIMNVMLVAVSQRKAEIGLLKALGAPTSQVLRLFLTEATLLASAGGALGLVLGLSGVLVLNQAVPDFSAQPPLWALIASVLITFFTGLLFGSIPARQAARLDPVAALSGR